jgi:hypothetical protein
VPKPTYTLKPAATRARRQDQAADLEGRLGQLLGGGLADALLEMAFEGAPGGGGGEGGEGAPGVHRAAPPGAGL